LSGSGTSRRWSAPHPVPPWPSDIPYDTVTSLMGKAEFVKYFYMPVIATPCQSPHVEPLRAAPSGPSGEGQDRDGFDPSPAERLCALVDGCPSRQDVVHQEHPLAGQAGRVRHGKGAPHVPGAFLAIQFRLGSGRTDPHELLKRQRKAEPV